MTGNIADRFELVADRHPDRIAVETVDGPVTYAQLESGANRFAAWLRSIEVEPGDTIGIGLGNRIEHVEVLLGAFKARAVPVNVNCHYTTRELADLLGDCQARVLIHEPTLDVATTVGADTICVEVGAAYDKLIKGQRSARINAQRDESDHYILYTGGSTGRPKGVVWRHVDLYEAVLTTGAMDTSLSRVLPACPFTHGTAQWSLIAALLNGSTVVLAQSLGLDAQDLWSRVETCGVTRLVIVGDAFAHPLLDALDDEPDRWNLSSLVAIISGGARWSETTRLGLLAHLPHVVMVNSFGASETGGQGAQVTFAGQGPEPITGLLRFTPDATSAVLDDDLRPIAPGSGTVGKLARTGAIPLGYLDDLASSAEVFPIIDGVRYAMPGDLATIEADGTIVVLGRDRNVINTGGEKVFAEEVEGRLVRHPAVADAVVVGIPDERWGESINALVTLHPGTTVTIDDLLDHCTHTLARFKVPRHITMTGSIRHLPSGKLDRVWAADTIIGSLP